MLDPVSSHNYQAVQYLVPHHDQQGNAVNLNGRTELT